MKFRRTSRKRVFLAVSMFAVFVITALISVVLVLASTKQSTASKITISYVTDGVGAKVKANYAIIPKNNLLDFEKVAMTNGQDEEISFEEIKP